MRPASSLVVAQSLAVALAIAVALAHSTAAAQERRLEPVVVEALGDPAAASPVETRIVDGRELEARSSLEVGEALRAEPGVQVTRAGGPGEDLHLRMRGSDVGHVLVLLDGVPLNDPYFYGLARLSGLDPGGIDRVEVVRGPFSALSGGSAIGGTVRLRTVRGEGPGSLSARADAGAPLALRVSGLASAGDEGGGVAAWLSAARAGEPPGTERIGGAGAPRPESRFGEVAGAVSFSERLLGGELTAVARAGASSRRLGVGVLELEPVGLFLDDDRVLRRTLVLGSLRFARESGPHAWSVRAGAVQLDSSEDDPFDARQGVPGSVVGLPASDRLQPVVALDRLSRTLLAGTDHALLLGAAGTLLAGAELQSLSGSSSGTYEVRSLQLGSLGLLPVRSEESRVALGAYVADRVRAGPVDAEAGVRADVDGRFGAALSPRATAGVTVPGPRTRLSASYGEGFRAPSFIELAGTPLSNPDLEAERAWSAQLAAHQPIGGGERPPASVSVAAFRTRFEDLITVGTRGDGSPVWSNVREATVDGVEAAVDWTGPLRAGASLTLLDAEDGAGEPLLSVSSVLASARAGVSVGPFDGDAYWYAWDARPGFATVDLAGALREETPAGSRLDVTTSFLVSETRPGLRLAARLEDALDGRDEELAGFPAPGRSILLSLEVSTD